MTRVKRMTVVQKVVDDRESHQAVQLGLSQRRVTEAEGKLGELQRYEADYREAFARRGKTGGSSLGLRDFQVFLARLGEAIAQQKQVLKRAHAELDAERKRWQSAATKASAVRHIVDGWRADERRAGARREQHELDERAQRSGNKHTNDR